MDYKGYRELQCYVETRLLSISISTLTKKFPSHEKFQIIDSSRSIIRNVAEGVAQTEKPNSKSPIPNS